MRTVGINEFIKKLRLIPEQKFCVGNVQDFLTENPVDADSLDQFVFFSRNSYTRNLVFKNELFEVLAVCWQPGQASLIHDHADENCWMTMPIGKLRVQNYRLVEADLNARLCRLEAADSFDLTADNPAEVQLEEPLHQVLNPLEFDQKAVSLHIYSRPFDRCNVYSLQKGEIVERKMCYTSVYGKLCADARL